MDFSDVLLTVDYDRTLTAPDSTIPERNLEAIRYFIDHGGAFTVNTGRSLPMAKPFMELVPVNAPLLLYNGSAAYDVTTGKLDFCHEIPLDLWETVNTARTLLPDLTVEVQGLEAHYTCPANPSWEVFCHRQQCACRYARPRDDLGTFLKFSIYGAFHDDTVNSLFSGTEEEVRRMDQAEALMKKTFGSYCEVFRAAARIIDIHAKGVSKARSARELQARLGRKILVCAGDADNDLSMMREADFAYAPADGHIADQFETVCGCASGAVADVIFEKIPGILQKLG